MMRLAAAGVGLALIACSPSAADAPMADQWASVPLRVESLEVGAEVVGRLRFRGALALSSTAEMFGGFSGIEVLDDGRLVAVTDNADWLEARLVLDEQGALVGLENARMAFMRDEQAVPFASKVAGDAEALAQLPDGRFAVAFEQSQTIRIYDLNRDGPFGAAAAGPVLAGAERLPGNAGLEALAADASGALIIGAEGGGGRTPLWRVDPDAREPAARFGRYRLAPGFSLTGMDRLPDGGFVALERFYAPIIGAQARITMFAAEALQEGALIEPTELAHITAPMPVDNFEGIAAVRLSNGVTRLYIISDDNFSARQRTLLVAFDIVDSAAAN